MNKKSCVDDLQKTKNNFLKNQLLLRYNYSIPLLQNEYKASVNRIVETTYKMTKNHMIFFSEPLPPTPFLTALLFDFFA